MTTWEIDGGSPLQGEIQLIGAKNSVTKLIVLSMMSAQPSVLLNAPNIGDNQITKDLCEALGTQFTPLSANSFQAHTPTLKTSKVPFHLGSKNRLAIMVLPALLHRCGHAEIPMAAGGDRIGPRPVDFHLEGFRKMGARVTIQDNDYVVDCDGLRGAEIVLPFPSVTTTENLLIGATLARGRTFIHNAAIEPEIMDLVCCLQKMGAIIDYSADRTFVIEGVKELTGFKHEIMPDRIVAASLACAAIASKGDVFVRGARQVDLITFLNTLRRLGCDFDIEKDGIRFYYTRPIRSISLEIKVHPGFMTDWQPPLVMLLTQANGMSVVHETVFENRFGYVSELQKMGADIALYDNCLGGEPCRFRFSNYQHSCVIKGPTQLKGSEIQVPDLRAGFSYLIAASIAQGKSTIHGVEHIKRGYEEIEKNLSGLGMHIQEVEGETV